MIKTFTLIGRRLPLDLTILTHEYLEPKDTSRYAIGHCGHYELYEHHECVSWADEGIESQRIELLAGAIDGGNYAIAQDIIENGCAVAERQLLTIAQLIIDGRSELRPLFELMARSPCDDADSHDILAIRVHLGWRVGDLPYAKMHYFAIPNEFRRELMAGILTKKEELDEFEHAMTNPPIDQFARTHQ